MSANIITYIEETLPKNLATSIKNNKFLDFFFRHIRRLRPQEIEILQALHVDGDYPFVSPCGHELNFVRPADSAIVFHTLKNGSQDLTSSRLAFGGTLTQPFHPKKLVMSKRTGRLYHELSTTCYHGTANASMEDETDGSSSDYSDGKDTKSKGPTLLHDLPVPEYGLIRSSVAVALSENIVFCSNRDATSSHSDMNFVSSIDQYPIPWLPEHAEPGPWSMPVVEGDKIID